MKTPCRRACAWPFSPWTPRAPRAPLSAGRRLGQPTGAHAQSFGRRTFSASRGLLQVHEQAKEASGAKADRFNDRDERRAAEDWARDKQKRRPWHRAGSESELPSSSSDPTNGDKTKGRLLTTPTRLLKLILPLPFQVDKANRTQTATPEAADTSNPEKPPEEEIQPLALLVHPQQPLSYLERLLQAELPPIRDGNREKIPSVVFLAEADGGESPRNGGRAEDKNKSTRRADGNVSSYSGLGREGPERPADESRWVRWSSSTEIGDFIRDAARGREFALSIEGRPGDVRVAVPSFNDRTYYTRLRLRKLSGHVEALARIKRECDGIAHRGAHRLAQGGFGVLLGWWGVVYYVTFHTDSGWDLVEPITYLVGLTTIIGGYTWFLYISKDLSYKAALNLTVSRRRQALYQARGFDAERWNTLVQEANALRHEIKMVASEYDVEWDEARDLGGEEVKEVLEKEEEKKSGGKKKEEEEDGEEEVRKKDEDTNVRKQEDGPKKGGDGEA